MSTLTILRPFFHTLVISVVFGVLTSLTVEAQQVIKARSKPTSFNITPIAVVQKDTTTITIGPKVELYKNEKKTALVIGNGEYTSVPLRNAVNDALDMAASLSEKGFTVILRKNA